jgi:hypothetical protein
MESTESSMSVDLTREIVVEAVLNDPYDGAIRLLGDAQRFGFELQSLTLTAQTAAVTLATITLRVPTSFEAHLVAARLSRHPALQRVNVCADAGKDLRNRVQPVAA